MDPDLELEVGDLHKCLKSFPSYTAPGPSGLRATHISEALTCGASGPASDLEDALLGLMRLCLSGALPSTTAPFFGAARLIPLRKKDGGIRPIAVGEVLRRLAGKILIRMGQDEVVQRHLYPVQLGVGVRGATELIARSTEYFLAQALL